MLLVGEAWGDSEEATGQPFVGHAGKELWKLLGEASGGLAAPLHTEALAAHRHGPTWTTLRDPWLEAAGVALTNVLNLHPPANNLDHLCVEKKEYLGLCTALADGPPGLGQWPPLIRHPRDGYLHPTHLPQLQRLCREISLSRPNLVVALGATAAWALLRTTAIGSIRGAVAFGLPLWGEAGFGGQAEAQPPGEAEALKVLPTYHPAAVLRNWAWRPIVLADLMKAFREAEFPQLRRPQRQILVNPSLAEATSWVKATLASPPATLACDIETKSGQITCIGFARSPSEALVLPFAGPGGSYWPTLTEELQAWFLAEQLLNSGLPLVFQNGLYDLQYLRRQGLRIARPAEDTMLLHHSLHPELLKGLGFLGSIYTNEASWKLMRRKRDESNKADD